jgi:hypothetical protein
MNRDELLEIIEEEVIRAKGLYPTFNSTHEGYAVIFEEIDELWDLVRKNKGIDGDLRMKNECIQIAAMAIRFIEDLCSGVDS